jgi:hypothetical protein
MRPTTTILATLVATAALTTNAFIIRAPSASTRSLTLPTTTTSPAAFSSSPLSRLHAQKDPSSFHNTESFAPLDFDALTANIDMKSMTQALAVLAPLLLLPSDAMAKGGEWGILEGRTFAFVHPLIMGVLFLTTAYTGYLGWQFRSTRTIASEITALKDTLPKLSDGSKISTPVSKQVAAVEAAIKGLGEGGDASKLQADLATLRSAAVMSIDGQVSELSEKRKQLLAGDFRDKHYNTASTLLGLGVFTSILGGFNTFFRAGKLFPGPHLYAGAGITVLWAVAASLVPSMQKGNEAARTLHIGLNALNLALFAWQVGTGLEIAIKVWGFTKWP